MKKSLFKSVMLVILAIIMVVGSCLTVNAASYSEKSSGTSGSDCTLYYKNPHGDFYLRVWVTGLIGSSKKYSIAMYDNAGRCVWSAQNRGDQTYRIGGNVTKIVLTMNDSLRLTSLHWQKK